MIFILILLGLLLYYFHKPIIELLKGIKFRDKNKDVKLLKSHDIFNTLERVKQEGMFIKFYSHGKYDKNKSKMCSDFVKYKCEVCFDRFNKFLDKNLENINSAELKQMMLAELWSMHAEYVGQIKTHWIDKGITKEDVDYVVDLFETFRHSVIMSFQYRTDSIFSCEHYDTNFKKILACYDCFAFGIDLLPKDLQDTFETVNGKFADIPYK